MTKTPKDLAALFWLNMMTRGLGYRNDGPKLADAKRDAFQRMLQKYPPDVARVCCEKLRHSGFFPSIDEVELEIQELLQWRNEVYEALVEGEIYSQEQIWNMNNRSLGFRLTENTKLFPIWDNGKPARLEHYQKTKAELKAALDEYLEFNPSPQDFMDKRAVSLAQDIIAEEFGPCPHRKPETAEERQERMKLEREEMDAKKVAMTEDLKKS